MKKLLTFVTIIMLLGACVSEDMRNTCRQYIDYSNQGAADFACGFQAIFSLGYNHW